MWVGKLELGMFGLEKEEVHAAFESIVQRTVGRDNVTHIYDL